MASKTIIEQRLVYWKGVYEKLQTAYTALIDGGVKSYMIDDRQLTRFDLPVLMEQMKDVENKIDELDALLNGQKRRKAFGIYPRDW